VSAARKLFQQMSANCRDWQLDDALTLAKACGFTWRRTAGSHVVLKHGRHRLTIPAARPIKPIYIRRLLELIEVLGASP